MRYMPQPWVYWLNGQNTKLFYFIKWKILFDSSKPIHQLLNHFMMCHMYGTLLVMWSQHFLLMNWKCFSVNIAVFTNLKICTFSQSIDFYSDILYQNNRRQHSSKIVFFKNTFNIIQFHFFFNFEISHAGI